MRIRCTREFRDLSAKGKPLRRVGDEWEATASRLAEINSGRYGVMAEAVGTAARAKETASAARKPATRKRGTAAGKSAHRTDQEG